MKEFNIPTINIPCLFKLNLKVAKDRGFTGEDVVKKACAWTTEDVVWLCKVTANQDPANLCGCK